MNVDARHGKDAETEFRVLSSRRGDEADVKDPQPGRLLTPAATLIEARPLTGRTHQIRVHLAESGCPVVGDELYGRADDEANLGLRAVRLAYADPFTRRRAEICAPVEEFAREYGFDIRKL
jgi:23S rRNA-/tRNA-specific pseudouridylate synthase